MDRAILRNKSILEIAGLLYSFSIAFSATASDGLVRIARILIVVTFLLEIVKKSGMRKVPSSYYKWSILFFLFSSSSWLWAASRATVTASISTQFYILIVNWILLYVLYRKPDFIFSMMNATIWGAFLHGVRVYSMHGVGVYFATRGGQAVQNANVLASVTSFAVIFTISLLVLNKTKNRTLTIILGLINFLFALLTASKKIFVFIGVFVVLLYVLKSRKPAVVIRKMVISLLAVAAFAMLIFKVEFLYNLVGMRIETMIAGFLGSSTDASTSFRLRLIEWGMEWFSEKPYVGYGLDNFKYLLGSTYNTWAGKVGVYAHNNYIELLVNFGLAGTLLYYSLYFSIIQNSWKWRKQQNLVFVLALAMIVSLLVSEYGQVSYMNPFFQEVILVMGFLSFGFTKESTAESGMIEGEYGA